MTDIRSQTVSSRFLLETLRCFLQLQLDEFQRGYFDAAGFPDGHDG